MFALQEYWVGMAYLFALAIIFVGMSVPVMRMLQGTPPHDVPENSHESLFGVIPPLFLCLLAFGLGLYIPDWLNELLNRAATMLGA